MDSSSGFWGFRSQSARVHTLLYLHDTGSMSALIQGSIHNSYGAPYSTHIGCVAHVLITCICLHYVPKAFWVIHTLDTGKEESIASFLECGSPSGFVVRYLSLRIPKKQPYSLAIALVLDHIVHGIPRNTRFTHSGRFVSDKSHTTALLHISSNPRNMHPLYFAFKRA